MKYDIDHLNRGKKRNLGIMSSALMELLMKNSYESISVTQLCDSCLIPKATFYNYFEDKDDLLRYVFDTLRFGILGSYDPHHSYDGNQAFATMIDQIDSHRPQLIRVIHYNPSGSSLYWHLADYMAEMFQRVIRKNPAMKVDDIPESVLTRVGAQTLITILYWGIPAGKTKEELALFIQKTSVYR